METKYYDANTLCKHSLYIDEGHKFNLDQMCTVKQVDRRHSRGHRSLALRNKFRQLTNLIETNIWSNKAHDWSMKFRKRSEADGTFSRLWLPASVPATGPTKTLLLKLSALIVQCVIRPQISQKGWGGCYRLWIGYSAWKPLKMLTSDRPLKWPLLRKSYARLCNDRRPCLNRCTGFSGCSALF